jgi:hypothetical protein
MHKKPGRIAEKILIFRSRTAKSIDIAAFFDKHLTCFAKKLSNQEKTLLGGGVQIAIFFYPSVSTAYPAKVLTLLVIFQRVALVASRDIQGCFLPFVSHCKPKKPVRGTHLFTGI